MFRKVVPLASIATVLFALGQSSNVYAGEPKGHGLTLTPMFGRMYTDTSRQVDDFNFFSFGVGYSFHNRFDVELTYGESTDSLETVAGDIDYAQWRLDGLLGLAPTSSINPYLALGVGQHLIDSAEDGVDFDDETDFVNFGIGAKMWITKQLAARVDLRQFIDTETVNGEKFHDTALMVGLTYAFGKPAETVVVESTPAPTPEPEPVAEPVDTDQDGVVDAMDECPDTSIGAKVDEKGCYIMITEVKEITLNINFASNSADVPASAMGDIAEVAGFMKEYPLTAVVLEGHTDNTGNDAYNQKLSEKRAASVAEVLVKEYGVSIDRVDHVGYGETQPIASNESVPGRAQNRRVMAVIRASVSKKEMK